MIRNRVIAAAATRVRPKETRDDANGDGTVVQRKQTPDYIDLGAAWRGSATVKRRAGRWRCSRSRPGIAAGGRRGKTARWKVGNVLPQCYNEADH